MFAITTKVKLATGIVVGVLTLGAASAYAAQNLPQTLDTPVISTLGTGTNVLKLVSLNGAPRLHDSTSPITNPGECVSFFATNRNYALVPEGYTTGPITISKANYHGKLMSGLNAWCKTQITPKTTTPTTPTVAQTDSTQSTGSPSGAALGHGHAYGHGKHANKN